MKPMTIWERLNTALMLFLLLLLAGVGLAIWAARSYSEALNRSADLEAARDRISLGLMRLTEALRDLAFDPRNKGRWQEAESDLTAELNKLERDKELRDFPDLLASSRRLRDFVTGTGQESFGDFQRR